MKEDRNWSNYLPKSSPNSGLPAADAMGHCNLFFHKLFYSISDKKCLKLLFRKFFPMQNEEEKEEK